MVVGLGWVEQCRKENSHVKEKDYLVDLASIPETSFGVNIPLNSRMLLISVI
jgi:hypothetical protein